MRITNQRNQSGLRARKAGSFISRLSFLLLFLFTTLQILPCPSQSGEKLMEVYQDRGRYFIAIPPDGWLKKEYPGDTNWPKVAFQHPKNHRNKILVIYGPVPERGYSLSDLYNENVEKVEQFRRKFPNGSFSMKLEKIANRDVYEQRNSITQVLEQLTVMFIEKNTVFSISLMASSKEELLGQEKIWGEFLRSFVVVKAEKEFSKEEAHAAMVGRFRELAELSEKLNMLNDARSYVQQGLLLDPGNKALKVIKARLQ